jgi:hypothetical protein
MGAAELSGDTSPRDQALQSLEDFSRFCEQPLFDFIADYELRLTKALADVDNYRQDLRVGNMATQNALSTAIARFRIQAHKLIYYYHHHWATSQSSAADGLAFVDGFSELQLKTLEESQALLEFLTGMD